MSEAKASIDKETVDQVAKFGGEHYKYGFTTEIDVDKIPNGLSEDIIRFISAKKEEPQWLLDWRLDAYERWKTMDEPALGACRLPENRLSGFVLLRGTEIDGRRPEKP